MRDQNLKWILSILVLILLTSIIGIAGCLSESNSDSNYNQTNTSSSGLNSASTPPSNIPYEASGYCNYVVDGDTINVEGIGRIRLSGVDTPERDEVGYQEAKDFTGSLCSGKTVYLNMDDSKHYDKYGRTLAVVYAGDTNVNAELLKRRYAEILYIPPSEFDPYSWK